MNKLFKNIFILRCVPAWVICCLFLAISDSLTAMDNQIAIVCNDGQTIHANRELLQGTTLDLSFLPDAPDAQGPIPIAPGLDQSMQQFFSSRHVQNMLDILAHQEHLETIVDTHELQACLVIGDFLGISENLIRSISLKIINTTPAQVMLPPHVNNIMTNSLNSYIVTQDDGTLRLDLHIEVDDGHNIGTPFRDPIKIISFFDRDTKQRISSIDLRNNHLNALNFEELMRQVPNLKNLDLSHNDFHHFGRVRLPEGFNLDISHNQLENIWLANTQQDGIRVNCSNNHLALNVQNTVQDTLQTRSLRDHLVSVAHTLMNRCRIYAPRINRFLKTTALLVGAGVLYSRLLYPKIISPLFIMPILSNISLPRLRRLAVPTFFASSLYHGIEGVLNAKAIIQAGRADAQEFDYDIIAMIQSYIAAAFNNPVAFNHLGSLEINAAQAAEKGIFGYEYYKAQPENICRNCLANQLTFPIIWNTRLWNKFQQPLERHVIDPILAKTITPLTNRIARLWDRGIASLEHHIASHQNHGTF